MTVLVLWPALGGHWVELWFLNWLRPRMPLSRAVHVSARIAVWFAGGVALMAAMYVTASAMGATRPPPWPYWWIGGLGFIAIELLVHGVLHLRGKSSFYDAAGPRWPSSHA